MVDGQQCTKSVYATTAPGVEFSEPLDHEPNGTAATPRGPVHANTIASTLCPTPECVPNESQVQDVAREVSVLLADELLIEALPRESRRSSNPIGTACWLIPLTWRTDSEHQGEHDAMLSVEFEHLIPTILSLDEEVDINRRF